MGMVKMRDGWLRAGEDRTMTALYNERPTWLTRHHGRLDRAVLDAYGWPSDIADDDLLRQLLELNAERASEGVLGA